MPGPAVSAPLPVSTKMPVPMMAPMPSMVRSKVFSVRFSGVDSETSWSTDFLRNRSMVVRFPVIVSKMGWTGRISGTLARLNARNQKGRGDMRNSLVYGKCKKHCRTKS